MFLYQEELLVSVGIHRREVLVLCSACYVSEAPLQLLAAPALD